jgi:hypothetical protein
MTPITNLLATMTNELSTLAIVWHVAVVGALAAAVGGWRPSRRVVALLAVLPLLSVALAALVYGNLFNGASFMMLALVLSVLGDGLPAARAEPRAAWSGWVGIGLIAYALSYSHFVDGAWYRALVAAPIGVVPCPTLALVCGVMLVAGASRAIAIVLAAWTAFYAVFGIFALHVSLDVGLLAAPVALLCTICTSDRDCITARRAPV